MGKVYPPKAGLAWPQKGFADGVVMAPNKIVIYGDVLKLGGVTVGPKHLLVPK